MGIFSIKKLNNLSFPENDKNKDNETGFLIKELDSPSNLEYFDG